MSTYVPVMRRLFEDVWNGADPEAAAAAVHPDYVIHDRDLADELGGPDLYRALASGTREVFPDASFAIEDALETGEKVALRWTMTGTHDGSLAGEAPTGTRVELSGMEIDRFDDGKLAETWALTDQADLLRQVGALTVGTDGE